MIASKTDLKSTNYIRTLCNIISIRLFSSEVDMNVTRAFPRVHVAIITISSKILIDMTKAMLIVLLIFICQVSGFNLG